MENIKLKTMLRVFEVRHVQSNLVWLYSPKIQSIFLQGAKKLVL